MTRTRPSQTMLVIAVAGIGVLIAVLLYVLRPEAERKSHSYKPASVQVIKLQSQKLHLRIHSQGKLVPAQRVHLASEINGKVIAMSPRSETGQFFHQGDWLVKIDDRDYRLAIDKAEAQVASARQVLAKAEAEASQAKFDAQHSDAGNVSDYALRIPHLKEARAGLKAARADLAMARLQLQRCVIKAPFDGVVETQRIEARDFVTTGAVLLDIYQVTPMEVYLPVNREQLTLLPQKVFKDNNWQLDVSLSTSLHGQVHSWPAQAVGFQGALDDRNQLYYLVVRLPMTKAMIQQGLLPGLFVDGEIQGKSISAGYRLPRQALRPGDRVWLVDQQDRLVIKAVQVLQKTPTDVLVKDGFADGDRVVTSALDIPVNGMQVTVIP